LIAVCALALVPSLYANRIGWITRVPIDGQFHFNRITVPGEVVDLGTISNDGRIVGEAYGGTPEQYYSFVYTQAGGFVPLNLPVVAEFVAPAGMNDLGQVAFWWDVGATRHSGIYDGVNLLELSVAGASGIQVGDINDHGDAVGGYWDTSNGTHFYGFLYAGGQYTTLDVPGAPPGETFAFGINDNGAVVGTYYDSAFHGHGFIYSGGKYTTIDCAQTDDYTQLNDINDAGQIVGWYIATGSNLTKGFLYSGGTCQTIDTGAFTTEPTGVNDDGVIVGVSDLVYVGLPEPGTLMLLCTGAIGLGGAIRRKVGG
jgi:probable HAF family extracellular repeat protein